MKLKVKQIIIPGIIILLCLAGTWYGLQRPALPLTLEEIPSGQVIVTRVTAATSAALSGDILLDCDGHPVQSLKSLQLIIDGKKIGDQLPMHLLRKNLLVTGNFQLLPHYSLRYLFITIPFGLLFYGLALFVNLKRPDKPEAKVFYYNMLAIAVMYFFPWRPYNPDFPAVAIFLQLIYLTAYAATPLFFLKFSRIYPREKSVHPTHLRVLPVLLFAVLVLWLTLTYALAISHTSFEWYARFTLWFNIFRILFSVSLLFALAQFVHAYFTALEEEDRRKLRWILLGLAIGASAIVFLWTIPQIFLKRGLLPEEFVLLICAIVPISFAISIVRHHLLDIDIIFNRSVVYAIIFLIIAAIYAVAIGTLAYLVSTLTIELSSAVSAVLAALIVMIFEPLRQRIQKIVDKTFFRMRYDYRKALQNFSEELHHCLTVMEAGTALVKHIDFNLLPEFAGFYECAAGHDRLKLLVNVHLPKPIPDTDVLQTSLPSPAGHQNFACYDYLESQSDFAEFDLHSEITPRPVLLFYLKDENRQSQAALILGPKKSGFRYSLEDIDLLRACVNQAAETIARLHLQQKLIYEQELAQSLAALSKTKSQFISSVTHELKTPLTAIKMFAEMLQNDKTSREKIREYATIIDGEADRLNRLIGTVLDFAKFEQGNKSFLFQAMDLNEVIQKAMTPFTYVFEIESFDVTIALTPDPLIIQADPDALIQIINNLVNNAMKYSAESRKIAIASARQNGYAVLKVIDQGIGIAAADHKKIFDPFFRAPDQQVQRIGGAGLGLQVVKSIVEAHNGRIDLDSEPEKGSTFSVFLPLEK